MCGRYTLVSPDELVEEFGLGELPFSLSPRFNVAPTQEMPVVCREAPRLRKMAWGISARSTDVRQSPLINARSETVHEKRTFRGAFRSHRCLVPASGYYEWMKSPGRARPHHVHWTGRPVVALAGIFVLGDEKQDRYAILTAEAPESLRALHNRVPVVVKRDAYEQWLSPAKLGANELVNLVDWAAYEEAEQTEVGYHVNKVSSEGPQCLQEGPDQGRLFDF